MDHATQIAVSVIGFLGVLTTAVLSYLTHRHAREINDAVNHRHQKGGPQAMKLYDLVLENHSKVAGLEARMCRVESDVAFLVRNPGSENVDAKQHS